MRLISFLSLSALTTLTASAKDVSILWAKPTTAPHITVDRGTLASSQSSGAARLDLSVNATNEASALPVLVTVENAPRAFTFVLSDVSADYPVWLPDDGVIVTDKTETRTYEQITAAIRRRGGQTKLQQLAAAAETTFDRAAATGRDLKLQTWLGVTRDMRLFRIDENMETFQPKFAGYDTPLPETPKQPATYAFQLGRGWGPRANTTTRHLDEQVLPILRGEVDDEAIHYDVTMFASLERSPLTVETLRGTDYLVADAFGHGHMFTPAQAEAEKKLHETELNSSEEVVLYARAVAINRGGTPQYALFRTAMPALATPISPKLPETSYEAAHGLGSFASGRVFAVSKLNGKPLPAEEMSILLKPGETATFEFFLPHRPVSRERALALAQQSFDQRLGEARMFWRVKLHTAAQWKLPEARIDEMVRAGLLHLDLITYGREPAGPLLPAIGLYTAIGSESAPIIQFMDSMGWHDTAARAIDFFLQKQHDDGFIQNFNGYMLETGAVLWTMGEHYRYTHDDAWLQRVHPHLTKAADYLIKWRERNMQPELKGKGYGLLDGKTADPEDPYRSYMLNGYAYLGLARAAEILRTAAPEESARYLAAANALRADIRTALDDALAHSPVVPLGDGTWVRAAPPWTNYRGPVMLHADGGRWFTHWTMTGRDSLLGPLYLVFQEVIGPREPTATELLQVNSELMLRDNVAFSQPYYSRHPWVHLQRGEANAFIQAWYAAVASLADRSTYTFSEHFAPASYHKTHEEAWFLMETRWMLYREDGSTLHLFSGAPRAYFRPGAKLSVQKAASYFGPLSFDMAVTPEGREVKITVDCPGARHPGTVEIRVPHPQKLQPVSVSGGGEYVAERESVRLSGFDGHAEIVLHY